MKSTPNTIEHMRSAVLFDGATRHSKITRFWLLLIFASIIAAAGVVVDSTATVIGAMIVAPMMLPIQGTMLSVVLADRRNLIRSIAFMVAGALVAIAIGYLVGLLAVLPVVAQNNSQVAGRVSPGLMDLLAALGTGAVGSVALVREDISDTLPGVAIAISLVPPLCVAGLTLESGAFHQSLGAVLLFLTNVAAILATGVIVMAIMGVPRLAVAATNEPVNRRSAIVVIAAMLVVVGIPLAINSVSSISAQIERAKVGVAAEEWTAGTLWRVDAIDDLQDHYVIQLEGSGTPPSTEELRVAIERAGVQPDDVTVILVPATSVNLGSR